MSTDEICAEKVGDFVTADAALFLWVPNPLLVDGLRVVEAWGFKYKTNFVWVKEGRSMYGKLGFYARGEHELLLLATRGSFLPEGGELPSSVIKAPKGEHSKKPERAYEIIEQMYPTSIPRMRELFQRGPTRPRWMQGHGNEAEAA
jgi:N6-adenosine-specific RNA methylase IME4